MTSLTSPENSNAARLSERSTACIGDFGRVQSISRYRRWPASSLTDSLPRFLLAVEIKPRTECGIPGCHHDLGQRRSLVPADQAQNRGTLALVLQRGRRGPDLLQSRALRPFVRAWQPSWGCSQALCACGAWRRASSPALSSIRSSFLLWLLTLSLVIRSTRCPRMTIHHSGRRTKQVNLTRSSPGEGGPAWGYLDHRRRRPIEVPVL